MILKVKDEAYTGPGNIINSSFLNGLKAPEESVIKNNRIFRKKKIRKKKNKF